MTILIPQLCWGEWSKQERVGQYIESLLCYNEKGIASQSQNKGGGPYGQ